MPTKPQRPSPVARHVLMLICAAVSLATGGCGGNKNPLTETFKGLMPPTPGEAARDAFNVYDADKRRNAIALLSASQFGGEEAYVRMYRLLIDDPDATVRGVCVKALGEHGSTEDAKLIVRRLTDEAAFVRWEASKALQKVHAPDLAVDPLVKAMQNDEDADVRMAAAYALGQYATPGVFTALVSALDDDNYSVVEMARQSLATLTGYDFGTDGSLWLIFAQQNEGKLFEKKEQYTWQPFQKPRGFMDKVQFWKGKPATAQPQVPTGMDVGS